MRFNQYDCFQSARTQARILASHIQKQRYALTCIARAFNDDSEDEFRTALEDSAEALHEIMHCSLSLQHSLRRFADEYADKRGN